MSEKRKYTKRNTKYWESKSMKYTDGKDRGNGPKPEVTNESLASLLDAGSSNPFGTTNLDFFERKLAQMSLEEKGMLCNKVNVRPDRRASKMDEGLLDAFRKIVGSRGAYHDVTTRQDLNPNDEEFEGLL